MIDFLIDFFVLAMMAKHSFSLNELTNMFGVHRGAALAEAFKKSTAARKVVSIFLSLRKVVQNASKFSQENRKLRKLDSSFEISLKRVAAKHKF